MLRPLKPLAYESPTAFTGGDCTFALRLSVPPVFFLTFFPIPSNIINFNLVQCFIMISYRRISSFRAFLKFFRCAWVKLLYFTEICIFGMPHTEVSVCLSSERHAVILGNLGAIPIRVLTYFIRMRCKANAITHRDHDYVNCSHGSFYYEPFL